jgi:hypothetical protein
VHAHAASPGGGLTLGDTAIVRGAKDAGRRARRDGAFDRFNGGPATGG